MPLAASICRNDCVHCRYFAETIRFRLPECVNVSGPRDPMFEPVWVDPARNTMHIYAMFLKFWHEYDLGGAVKELLKRVGEGNE